MKGETERERKRERERQRERERERESEGERDTRRPKSFHKLATLLIQLVLFLLLSIITSRTDVQNAKKKNKTRPVFKNNFQPYMSKYLARSEKYVALQARCYRKYCPGEIKKETIVPIFRRLSKLTLITKNQEVTLPCSYRI